jgi:hypothetical protein
MFHHSRKRLRWLALYLAITPPLFLVGTIVGRFIEALGEHRGWFSDPEETLGLAMSWASNVIASSWFLFVFGLTTGLAAGLWLDYFLRRKEKPGSDFSNKLNTPKQVEEETYKVLKHKLSQLQADNTYLDIGCAAPAHIEKLEEIAGIFEWAGWKAKRNKTPQEIHTGKLYKGIRISGFNEFLVKSVERALKEAGYKNVYSEIKELQVPRSNPKYPHVVNTIYVFIGH